MVAVAFPVAGQRVVVGAFHSVCSWRCLVRRLSALESVSGLVVFGGWPVETGLCCAWSGKKSDYNNLKYTLVRGALTMEARWDLGGSDEPEDAVGAEGEVALLRA